jgi:hypothetical protein
MSARPATARLTADIGEFRARHLDLTEQRIGQTSVTVDGSESPLGWLARRKGRDGRALIEPAQLLAGERLRADFTRAQMMPRVTADWSGTPRDGARGSSPMAFGEAAADAQDRMRRALDVLGPEFSGLLLDVCCFLKTLQDVERERGWPARSAKVVLQLGLDRLARHYGLGVEARGRSRGKVQTWLASDVGFVVKTPQAAQPSGGG